MCVTPKFHNLLSRGNITQYKRAYTHVTGYIDSLEAGVGLFCGRRRARFEKRTKDFKFRCLTKSLSFRVRLGKNVSHECGLLFYYVKIVFVEYLRMSGEIRYPNGPMGSEKSKQSGKKQTIWKEACVGAVMHHHQGGGALSSKKCRP